ncbi:hypothetical protein L486_01665 [Kwoniella mangroviensis CBS 10435]|uniref:YMC020W-like alpha/beta hydrolase domain-containing protein n=1 Tax=Kwoniella mangroviensis CBS 10435 TaxID=1331196 RepID=A0A1B9J2M7_9TREE|nr:hypothetical protein L486_01665 [Kwoniella mangroviensis CBS 10435]
MSNSRSTSRKPSVNSRPHHTLPLPLPASLRIPSITRRASNTQLSFVFAQGDSARSDALKSEDQLSKQLDGDLGGKQMGLRSRRSSSATIKTVRTVSGLRSPSPSHASVMEEDESQPVAGPSSSTKPTSPSADPISSSPPRQPSPSSPKRSLNPKASSSWLRWNSPAPLFPRSPSMSKGKGKAKEVVDDVVTEEDNVDKGTLTTPQPSTIPPRSDPVLPTPLPPPPPPLPIESPTRTISDSLTGAPPHFTNIKPDEESPPPVTKSRGWWGRSTSVHPTPLKESSQPSDHAPITIETSSQTMNIPGAPISSSDDVPTSSPQPISNPVVPPAAPAPTSSTSAQTSPLSATVTQNPCSTASTSAPPASQGWKGYLGWGTGVKEVKTTTEHTEDLAGTTTGDGKDGAPLLDSGSGPMDTSIASAPFDKSGQQEVESSTAQEPTASGNSSAEPAAHPLPWSSYLYSFVVPPPRQQPISSRQSAHSHAVEPFSSTEYQRPVHSESSPHVNVREATPIPHPEPENEHTQTPSAPASLARNPDRRPSTTGWLNYLAFRASQKKVAGSSINTNETDNKGTGEEVMDFSSDPDFPSSSTPAPSLVPPQGHKGRDVKIATASVKSAAPKPSQNLDVRKKRLSNASLVSNSSHTPASVSPKARSSIEGSRPGNNGSSLPPPPQAPTVQPNLVIPTFTDTFDRPPRCFLPAAQPQEQSETASGLTAATTGLAWKALGAVGSYVYGSGEGKHKVTPRTILENETEPRGRKEGRNVGSDLPRRIGLGSGTPDDGWRDVKRVVAVGVHGWFPAKMLNSVIGEPTGTSVKFANMMGQAVQQFFQEKGVDDIRLTLMPLEGEGTIESRVDRLYKAYLSNPAWINEVRRADAIFFAAHSQGCIVTTHLISRMIAQGHIRTPLNAEAKVAMLAMCGVHLGPLYSISTSTVIQPYLQWFENAAARELFEFQDSSSAVSVAYQKALSMVLENEVRVVLLASLNDQVVPIYGASFSTATHPLLLRALYVDGASYTQSDFMTNLLCFAFMLRNAGIDDQRLVEHLSEATAGSLTGVGHSTPYEELSSYSLAVQYLFHAGPARQPVPPLEIEPFSARDVKNDFELPWIMRALVDSPEVKDIFPGELRDLKEGILHWRPNTKVLKEIKKRLEPMAGRQSRLRALHTSPSSASLHSNGTGEGLGVSPGANKALQSGKTKARL